MLYWIDRFDPPADYAVAVSRAWKRDKSQLYVVNLRQPLPAIEVPLRQSDPKVLLDLQFVAGRAYDRGPYRRGAVGDLRAPDPPLRHSDVAWAEELLKPLRQRLRA